MKPWEGHAPREQALLERAYETFMGNVYEKEGHPWSPYRLVSPGRPRFKGVWNWDTAFHSFGLRRLDPALAREGILGFFAFQKEDGLLPDVIFEDGRVVDRYSKPPLFAWAVQELHSYAPDLDFLRQIYPKLLKNAAWWEKNRFDGTLFYYNAAFPEEPDYEKCVRYESGWDNAVRWDASPSEYWPIDLNCYMVLFYRAMKAFSSLLGEDPAPWVQKEKELTAAIDRHLWNGEFYADCHRFKKEISSVLTPASFMPLFAKIASCEQAQKMARIAKDPQKFAGTMPTVAFDDPQYEANYWRGPVWLNVAWFAAKGLKNYGFAVADTIRERVLEMVEAEKRGIFENYDPRTNRGLDKEDRVRCANFSWSCVFIMEFILGW